MMTDTFPFNNISTSIRQVKVVISPLLLAELVKTGWTIPRSPQASIECIEGLPPDAKYIRGGYDSDRDKFIMIFEHPSFDEVHLGGILPEVTPIFRETYLPPDSDAA